MSDERRFAHHDNPPWWLKELRERHLSDLVFCGCYEGDMGGEWDTWADPDAADYTVDYGTYSYSYRMGDGQRNLKLLIERVIAEAQGG